MHAHSLFLLTDAHAPTNARWISLHIQSGVVLGIGFGFWLNTTKRAGAALRPLYLIVALSLTACLFIQRYKDDLALGHNQSIMVSSARVHVPTGRGEK